MNSIGLAVAVVCGVALGLVILAGYPGGLDTVYGWVLNIVSMRTGEVRQAQRDLMEDMRVRIGSYLHGQIRQFNKNCANAMRPATFQNARLDKMACYKSRALDYYKDVAERVVETYENHVKLTRLDDPDPDMANYVVGAYQPSSDVPKEFENAGHPHYDTAAFNPDELAMAKALDRTGYPWVRNKERLDYRIPLPVKSGSSSNFFPDFLWWVNDVVWAIDPTAKILLDEKIRTKLLDVPEPLRIALIIKGKYGRDFDNESDEGWTLMRRRLGNLAPEKFDNLEGVLNTLIAESQP